MYTRVTIRARILRERAILPRAHAVISATDRQLGTLARFEDETVDAEPARAGKKKPEKNYQIKHFGKV
jgi:hypothetical protein